MPNAPRYLRCAGPERDVRPLGVSLQFVPYITDRDRIRLNWSAASAGPDASLGRCGRHQRAVRLQAARVPWRRGHGRPDQNNLATLSRVPFFGDSPLIGRLAAYDQTNNHKLSAADHAAVGPSDGTRRDQSASLCV